MDAKTIVRGRKRLRDLDATNEPREQPHLRRLVEMWLWDNRDGLLAAADRVSVLELENSNLTDLDGFLDKHNPERVGR